MSQSQGSALEHLVEQQLKDTDLSFLPHPTVMGVRPDFLVTLPDGRLLVVEAKTSADVSAAIRQMDLFVHAFDAAGGVIAVPDTVYAADQPRPWIWIVRVSDLPNKLRALAASPNVDGLSQPDDLSL
jgi:hypothetical protein